MEKENVAESMKFFVSHSYRDAARRKGHYALAFCSVFIVVLFSLVINTVVEKGPVIFLRLAEFYHGEMDGVVTPSGFVEKDGTKHEIFLNYSRYDELYHEKQNVAPRKLFGVQIIPESQSNLYHNNETKQIWYETFDKETNLPQRDEVYRQVFQ